MQRINPYDIEFVESNFSNVFPIWKNKLWPNRIHKIEPTSSIQFGGGYNYTYKNSIPSFWIATLSSEIIGVISGFQTNYSFRARGIWVDPDYRNNNIGVKLFSTIEQKALDNKSSFIWTMARKESVGFYHKMGLHTCGIVDGFEFGPHTWMKKNLNFSK